MNIPKSPSTVIAIAGLSGSGKSTIARHLISNLGHDKTALIAIDRYYNDLSHLTFEQRKVQNFDQPDAININRLVTDITLLSQGKSAQLPIYDFESHTQTSQSTEQPPLPFLIIEGIFALYYPQLKPFIQVAVYIEIPDHIALDRRIHRDCNERGRNKSESIAQFNSTVKKSIQRYIRPSAQCANLILSGTDDPFQNATIIQQHLATNT